MTQWDQWRLMMPIKTTSSPIPTLHAPSRPAVRTEDEYRLSRELLFMLMVPHHAGSGMRHAGDVTLRGCAAESKRRSELSARVTQSCCSGRTDGSTPRLLSELFRTLLRFISRRHVGTGDGVRGAAGGAVAGGADGSREGRARCAELFQLQQTGACDERTDTFHHKYKILICLISNRDPFK